MRGVAHHSVVPLGKLQGHSKLSNRVLLPSDVEEVTHAIFFTRHLQLEQELHADVRLQALMVSEMSRQGVEGSVEIDGQANASLDAVLALDALNLIDAGDRAEHLKALLGDSADIEDPAANCRLRLHGLRSNRKTQVPRTRLHRQKGIPRLSSRRWRGAGKKVVCLKKSDGHDELPPGANVEINASPVHSTVHPSADLSVSEGAQNAQKLDDAPISSQRRRGCCRCPSGDDLLRLIAYGPCCWIVLSLVCVLAVIAVAFQSPVFDMDFSNFLKADSEVSVRREGFLKAREHSRSMGGARRLTDDMSLIHSIFRIQIYYLGRGSQDIHSLRALADVNSFEKKIRALPGWQRLCLEKSAMTWRARCQSGWSFTGIMWPTEIAEVNQPRADARQLDGSSVDKFLKLDGYGALPLPFNVVLQLLSGIGRGYQNSLMSHDVADAKALRSTFEFTIPIGKISMPPAERQKQKKEVDEEWKKFIKEELYPVLQSAGTENIILYYQGEELDSIGTLSTLIADTMWAIGSMCFILVYLSVHTRSLLLGSAAVFITFLSIPLAYVFFGLFAGVPRLTSASFLSIFLMMGLGADIILVFTDFWEHSNGTDDDAGELLGDKKVLRLRWTYKQAGKACATTTFTTAASFLANLASVLQPLREFGFFMGLCILCAFGLSLLFYPAVLVAHDRLAKRVKPCCNSASRTFWKTEILLEKSKDDALYKIATAWLDGVLWPFRRRVFLLSCLVMALAACMGVLNARFDTNMPQIFPDEHNLNQIKKVAGWFDKVDSDYNPQEVAKICGLQDGVQKLGCDLHWCESTQDWVDRPLGSTGSNCSCMIFQSLDCSNKFDSNDGDDAKQVMSFSSQIVRDRPLPPGFFSSNDWQKYIEKALRAINSNLTFGVQSVETVDSAGSDPMVLEHWESGEIQLAFVSSSEAQVNIDSKLSTFCSGHGICYCGTFPCDSSYLYTTSAASLRTSPLQLNLELAPNPRRLAPGSTNQAESLQILNVARRMNVATPKTPPENQAVINIVWGLNAGATPPILGDLDLEQVWSYDDTFQASDPRAQRILLRFCRDLPFELLVVETICWVEEFREWLITEKLYFPVPASQFTEQVRRFFQNMVTLKTGALIKDYMWLENGKLLATYFTIKVDLSITSLPSKIALDHMKLWDDYVSKVNAKGVTSCNNAWHTSDLWIRAEAERLVYESTVTTIIVAFVCSFAGAFISTGGICMLALLAISSVAGVMVCLFFFMVVLLGWSLNVIDILGLIIFIGYSVTYSLHMVHRFGEAEEFRKAPSVSEERYLRVKHALQTMGSAIVGSAVTTLGASVFLLPCTMQIFVKLAVVLFAVTALACIFAVTALPAALLCFGSVKQRFGLCCCLKAKYIKRLASRIDPDESYKSVAPA